MVSLARFDHFAAHPLDVAMLFAMQEPSDGAAKHSIDAQTHNLHVMKPKVPSADAVQLRAKDAWTCSVGLGRKEQCKVYLRRITAF